MEMRPILARLRPETQSESVADKLCELGLDMRGLKRETFTMLRKEHENICAEGYYNPAYVAIRLFVWYVTDSGKFDAANLTSPGALSRSISTVRQWTASDPAQAAAIEIEVTALKLFLLTAFENVNVPRYAKLAAQDRLMNA
jgi:hypothetical protein